MRDRVSQRATVSLGSVAAIKSGGTPDRKNPRYWRQGGIPWVTTSEVDYSVITSSKEQISEEGLRNSAAKIFPEGTLLIALYGQGKTRGQVGILGIAAATNQACAAIQPNADYDTKFLFYVLQNDYARIRSLSNSGGQDNLSAELVKEIRVPVVPLPEQRKISEILRTWDEALEKLTAFRAAKVRRISSLRQRLFEAEYASHNRLQRAKDLFETVSERARPDLPLLAVMQDIGIVRRDELDRRVAMPDGDTSTYKVVRPGDFVISLRSFEGGLEYSSIIGLVSPAYTVLRPTTDLIGDYYRHFFKSRSFIGRLDKLIFGIRDGKQIAFRDFGDMYIPAPPVAEQEAQARALGSLEADLALEDERIAALTRQKRGLMQKLLTGEWRVASAEATEVAQ